MADVDAVAGYVWVLTYGDGEAYLVYGVYDSASRAMADGKKAHLFLVHAGMGKGAARWRQIEPWLWERDLCGCYLRAERFEINNAPRWES